MIITNDHSCDSADCRIRHRCGCSHHEHPAGFEEAFTCSPHADRRAHYDRLAEAVADRHAALGDEERWAAVLRDLEQLFDEQMTLRRWDWALLLAAVKPVETQVWREREVVAPAAGSGS